MLERIEVPIFHFNQEVEVPLRVRQRPGLIQRLLCLDCFYRPLCKAM